MACSRSIFFSPPITPSTTAATVRVRGSESEAALASASLQFLVAGEFWIVRADVRGQQRDAFERRAAHVGLARSRSVVAALIRTGKPSGTLNSPSARDR